MMDLSRPLALSHDLLFIPVRDLPDESRGRIDCAPEDVAVSRVQGRSGSKIVDAGTAELLTRFRQPRTLVEAVILFSRERELDPEQVFENAFPVLKGMVEGGFLVPAGEGATGPGEAPPWEAGTVLDDLRIERCLQALEDSEVYLVARRTACDMACGAAGGMARSILKIESARASRARPGEMRHRFEHEAKFLAALGGTLAPATIAAGEIDGRAFVEVELIRGVEASVAAAEWKEREGSAGREPLLRLLAAIARAYAELHERGVVHGDVHPRNILVGRDGEIRLIDFGSAVAPSGSGGLPAVAPRAGVPFFYEPELAAAALADAPAPPASAAGEQFALGALLYLLATGAHWRDFSLGREEMLRELAEAPPLPFAERGVAPWPELEAILRRALDKRPERRFASVGELHEALAGLANRSALPPRPEAAAAGAPGGVGPSTRREALVDRALEAAALDGPWLARGLGAAPTASVNYGAAGIALALLRIAQGRRDAALLALADCWAERARREIGGAEAFHNAEIQITPEIVGESSLYHSPSGVHLVRALVARARADVAGLAAAQSDFLAAAALPAAGLDLTLGSSGTLLGSALLLEALPVGSDLAAELALPLRERGDAELARLWTALDAKPETARADVDYLGMAHGWAGFLYATLVWCAISGTALPSGVERRLRELAALAIPDGRGLRWPWVLRSGDGGSTMPGWCNGSCGHLFLWLQAHRRFGDAAYLELARGAAWDSWEAPESGATLCCGYAGRAYALLAFHRRTGESVWLDRARDLAARAARAESPRDDHPHSLYKGELGLVLLLADLERPGAARLPLFEPEGDGS